MQGRRADQPHVRAQLVQPPEVGPGDAAVQDVADNRDSQAFNTALDLADGQQIQQALGRMLVRPVAGIDDRLVRDILARPDAPRR